MNWELPDDQVGFRKGRGTRDKIVNNPLAHRKSKRIPEKQKTKKPSTSALLTMPKPLTVWITTNYGKFLTSWEYQTTLRASWEICMQVKKEQLEPDMELRLVPNWERNTSRLYILTLLMKLKWRVHHEKCWLEEAQAGIKIARRNINNLRYAGDTTLMA